MSGNTAAPGAGGFPLGVGQVFTPGGPVTSNVYTQVAFDPRMNKPVFLEGKGETATGSNGDYLFNPANGLARGFIVQAMSQSQTDGTLYGCAFLFNPSIITMQHGLDSNATSLTLPQYRRNAADTGVYLVGLASTLDLSLFFDRTYEVNTSAEKSGVYSRYGPLGFIQQTKYEGSQILVNDDPRLIGVLADIRALYRVVGMSDPIPNVSWTNDSGGSVTATITGPMQQVPCYLMLSANMITNVPYWYGYIDSIGITYTHFTQTMVPMRAQVDVELTLLPDVSGTSGATGSTGTIPANPFPNPLKSNPILNPVNPVLNPVNPAKPVLNPTNPVN